MNLEYWDIRLAWRFDRAMTPMSGQYGTRWCDVIDVDSHYVVQIDRLHTHNFLIRMP